MKLAATALVLVAPQVGAQEATTTGTATRVRRYFQSSSANSGHSVTSRMASACSAASLAEEQ